MLVIKWRGIRFVINRRILLLTIFLFVCCSFLSLEFGSRHINYSFLNGHPIDVVYTWVNGSDPRFRRSLKEYTSKNAPELKTGPGRDYAGRRFDDKYELKFSLRSLEMYAPWIRHVYLVTNGQIPHWLNLDCKKMTVIKHEDIFVDATHLPTFSSPAIETHLHNIPGLSERFIYFNDDIFIGAPIYEDDFVSSTRGYLIYLAHPVPMCADDCSWIYVGDGQCDSACLNAECQMDGGDCNFSEKVVHAWENNLFNLAEHNGSTFDFLLSFRNEGQTKSWQNVKFNNTEALVSTSRSFIDKKRLRLNLEYQTNISFIDLPEIVQRHNRGIILNDKIRRKVIRKKSLLKIVAATTSTKIRTGMVDPYSASLQHSNRVFNLKYGFKQRYVPAHAPIMIEKAIMKELQAAFPKEFSQTSKNRVRNYNDMQFAFSYYYYLISERISQGIAQVFDRFDTDKSRTWADREIRTILTKLYQLPLSYAAVDHFEELLMNCSKMRGLYKLDSSTPEYERYIDSKLPTVTKDLIVNCPGLSSILTNRFGSSLKYKWEIISNSPNTHASFKMLFSNVSEVVGHLDDIRRHTRKFVCLNDNLDEQKTTENELIRAVLYDFYMSMFPQASEFELPEDFRNRFLYVDELNAWKSYHFKLKICTYMCVLLLCCLLYMAGRKRLLGRQHYK